MRVKKSKPVTSSKKEKMKTIHNIMVVDASGSMGDGKNSKFQAAINGVNEAINTKQEEVNYLYSVMLFSNRDHETWKAQQVKEGTITGGGIYRGLTALNDAIVEACSYAKKNPHNQILLEIFTDGHENNSVYSKQQAAKAIEELKELGATVTFIGTEHDVQNAISMYNIDASNTYVHENTVETVTESYTVTRGARAEYSKRVAAGEDVKADFYSKKK